MANNKIQKLIKKSKSKSKIKSRGSFGKSRMKSSFGRSKAKMNSVPMDARSMLSLNKFQRERNTPDFDFERLGDIMRLVNEDWIQFISICFSSERNEEDITFFSKAMSKMGIGKKTGEKGVEIARENLLAPVIEVYGVPEFVRFPYFFFDLKRFVEEEKKSILVMKEIQLLNIVSSVVCGLSICRQMKLPHGNLSRTTIYKNGKHSWSISAPLYSRVNLKKRFISLNDRKNILIEPFNCVDYLVAPEVFDIVDMIKKCKFKIFKKEFYIFKIKNLIFCQFK